MERYRVKTVTINDQMLDIYCEFAGDIDGYARCGKPSQRLVIDDEQWIALTNFLQELHVLASGRATPPYAARLSVKEPMPKTTARLTLEGHAVKSLAGQALAGLMKPNLVSDLIQRGALR